jgi:uncharacterized iron-regulated membrane protein
MKLIRRVLILAHRYLGIAIGLLVIMWFATGIVMMYAGGMPRLTPQLRIDRLAAVDISQVRLTPTEAAERADASPGRTLLLSVMDRPAYRFGGTTIFADTGEVLPELTAAQARTVASRFMDLPEDRVEYVTTITSSDQWTLNQGRQMPQHKFRVDDDEGTELYVQASTGEVGVVTTRRSRALAWIGTIPHWLYFAGLRANQPLWYRIVVWTSAIACVLSVLGLILAVVQFRKTRPFRLAASIPYAGWLRWHYITGGVFGVFTLTFAFSGLLSMEPFAWTSAEGLDVRRDVFTGGPLDLSRFGPMDATAWERTMSGRTIKEIEFTRIQDRHYYVVRHAAASEHTLLRPERLHQPYPVTGRAEQDRLLIAADTLEVRREPFSVDSLMARLGAALPDVTVVEAQLLSEYDSYYYSRGRQTPLPVLRVKFADPAETWVYVDPEMSQVLATIHRLNRVERWLYNGLHSLDFAFWYDSRPLWDIGMIVLSLGGLTTSVLGLTMGVKRMRRGTRRVVRAVTAVGHTIPARSADMPAARTMNS